MGTIIRRKRKDGSTGYTAQVRVKKNSQVIHAETQTFDREPAAKAWMKKRETELAEPGALDRPEDPLLSAVIDQYLGDKLKPHGSTKEQVLQTIKKSWLGEQKCSEIKSPTIIKYLEGLKCLPQTRINYLSHLSAVITVARPAWGYPIDRSVTDDARVVAEKLGLIGRSKARTRRPTLAELDKLMAYYTVYERKQPIALAMRHMILFSIFSTRRQDETCQMLAEDLIEEHSEIIVRDMKNPGQKMGNDVTTLLTPEALQLIKNRGVTQGRIWPFNSDSVSSNFTRTCQILGIEDLHFHDLRHDGISRLFEMGWTIPRVALVSGHRSWQSLQRYTQFKQVGDKYESWSWKEKLLAIE